MDPLYVVNMKTLFFGDGGRIRRNRGEIDGAQTKRSTDRPTLVDATRWISPATPQALGPAMARAAANQRVPIPIYGMGTAQIATTG